MADSKSQNSRRPLKNHTVFATSCHDELSAILDSRYNAQFVKLPSQGSDVVARANAFCLSQSEVRYCSYGMPLSIKFAESGHLRIQFQHCGVGNTWLGRNMTPVTESQASISTTAVVVDYAADFEQLVWLIPIGKLEQKLATLIGRRIGCRLEFAPTLDLGSPRAATLRGIFDCLIRAIDSGINTPSELVITELEQALIATLLATAQHSGRALLDGEPAGLAPWQVRRAESYIEAHWDQPITIEDLARVTGTSTRSLFRAFRASRGYSPMEFVRLQRLARAQRMLEEPVDTTNVTGVALACGFSDPGRFAREYTQVFGERPSKVLARNSGFISI